MAEKLDVQRSTAGCTDRNPPLSRGETTMNSSHKANIRKPFFGKDTCLVFQANGPAGKVFLDVGKKEEDAWKWNKAKIDDEEMGEILLVLQGEAEEASFYHEFEGNTTKIWVNRKQDKVYFRIEGQSKALTPAQQAILKVLLREAIVTANIETDANGRRERKAKKQNQAKQH